MSKLSAGRWFAFLFCAQALCATSFGAAAALDERPNILWITSEDNGVRWLHCYGNAQATTPTLDRMAAEGFRYTHCFSNTPVCAPSRFGWITGIHAVSAGTQHMRSQYEIPHDRIGLYPDYLREAGYYCTNHRKTDYNFSGRAASDCWDDTEKYGWKKRAPGQPFFTVINLTTTHESSLFPAKRKGLKGTKVAPKDVTLAQYHPDIPEMREDYAVYLEWNRILDEQIGTILAELEKDGLAEDTIVVYNSDHGGVVPRGKRFLLDTGTHCPLIVRIPEKFKALWPAASPGTPIDRLVSFIDMPKTWLSLAGAKVPEIMQGKVFLGPDAEPEASYHIAYRGRMDDTPYDMVRSVRGKRYLYIRNYLPDTPRGQYIWYMFEQPSMAAWHAYHKAGKTDAVTGRFFRPKPFEELYDCEKDPENINNLAQDPSYREMITRMHGALRNWQLEIHDAGLLREPEMAYRAEQHQMTIYDFVRRPGLYNLPALLDAADLAAQADHANLPKLKDNLASSDSGVRYWGAIGCVALGEEAAAAAPMLKERLLDPSAPVAVAAAWALVKCGEEDAGLDALLEFLTSEEPLGVERTAHSWKFPLEVISLLGRKAEKLHPALARILEADRAQIKKAADKGAIKDKIDVGTWILKEHEALAASGTGTIPVLILSGQNNHEWQETTPFLKQILEDTGRFSVDITEHPEQMSAEQLKPYAIIVSNWNAYGNRKGTALVTEWPKAAQAAYLNFVLEGKGHVVVHAGASSFYGWEAYQQLIGGASWKLGQTNHGPRHVFKVRTATDAPPIAKGIGAFYTHDELWNDTGIAKDATVIAEAFSSEEHRGSGKWEPIAAVNPFGKGRNFTLLLGHDAISMANPGFRALLVRGTEWAATGQVRIPVPDGLTRTEASAGALFKHENSVTTSESTAVSHL